MRCHYCGDSNPGVVHLFAHGPAPDLRVGSIVVAKKATGVCGAGEAGVVYAEHRLHERVGCGILFEGGNHDGFNACEVDWYLTVTGEVCEEVADYAFKDARRLTEDFCDGRFAPAFNMIKTRASG